MPGTPRPGSVATVVAARCDKLGLECVQAIDDKVTAFRDWMTDQGLDPACRHDGGTLWARVSANLIFDNDGKMHYALATIQDVSERHAEAGATEAPPQLAQGLSM